MFIFHQSLHCEWCAQPTHKGIEFIVHYYCLAENNDGAIYIYLTFCQFYPQEGLVLKIRFFVLAQKILFASKYYVT